MMILIFALAPTITKLLHNKEIYIDDSLFSVGGDSLLAINLSSIISEKYNINITVSDILKNQVLSDLSDLINNRTKENLKSNIFKTSKKDYYPISSAQKRIYYSCLKNKDSLLYNIAGGVVLDKELDKNSRQLSNLFFLSFEKEKLTSTFVTCEKFNFLPIKSTPVVIFPH